MLSFLSHHTGQIITLLWFFSWHLYPGCKMLSCMSDILSCCLPGVPMTGLHLGHLPVSNTFFYVSSLSQVECHLGYSLAYWLDKYMDVVLFDALFPMTFFYILHSHQSAGRCPCGVEGHIDKVKIELISHSIKIIIYESLMFPPGDRQFLLISGDFLGLLKFS